MNNIHLIAMYEGMYALLVAVKCVQRMETFSRLDAELVSFSKKKEPGETRRGNAVARQSSIKPDFKPEPAVP